MGGPRSTSSLCTESGKGFLLLLIYELLCKWWARWFSRSVHSILHTELMECAPLSWQQSMDILLGKDTNQPGLSYLSRLWDRKRKWQIQSGPCVTSVNKGEKEWGGGNDPKEYGRFAGNIINVHLRLAAYFEWTYD